MNADARDRDRPLTEVVARERSRLLAFIRRRVADPRDAEDIVQDVFFELVQANRLLMPIDHVTAWLFRVARNRITDAFRRRRPEHRLRGGDDDAPDLRLEELLPSLDDGPEALYLRTVLFTALEEALAELPAAQREVFVAHEIEGTSFKALAAATGVGVSTLLSRKRYAVLHLRKRLQEIHEAFTTT